MCINCFPLFSLEYFGLHCQIIIELRCSIVITSTTLICNTPLYSNLSIHLFIGLTTKPHHEMPLHISNQYVFGNVFPYFLILPLDSFNPSYSTTPHAPLLSPVGDDDDESASVTGSQKVSNSSKHTPPSTSSSSTPVPIPISGAASPPTASFEDILYQVRGMSCCS